MSCRVIGRGMERLMLRTLIEAARTKNKKYLKGVYVPTQKNSMVSGLYPGFEFRKADGAEREEIYLLDLGNYLVTPDDIISVDRIEERERTSR